MKLNIKNHVLYECELDKDWEDVIIPDEVHIISQYAFDNLKLGKVVIPEIISQINTKSFSNCKIKEMIVHSPFINEFDHAFFCVEDCKIEKMTFDAKIAPHFFINSSIINTLTFTDQVHIIGSKCLRFTNIKKINFGANVEAIDHEGISYSSIDEKTTLPASLKFIGDDVLSSFLKTNTKFLNKDMYYVGPNTNFEYRDFNIIDVPEVIIDNIYFKRLSADAANIKEGVRIIYDNAFESLNVDEVNLPESLIHIGKAAFTGCKLIKEIKIPKNVQGIGKDAFYKCNGLKKVDLGNVTYIGNNAFAKTGLREVKIPASINVIDNLAFNMCPYLKTLELSKEIKKFYIAPNVISDITKLKVPKNIYKANPEIFEPYDKNLEIQETTLEELIEQGKSISEINQILKDEEENIR